jgi:hypothetical protein
MTTLLVHPACRCAIGLSNLWQSRRAVYGLRPLTPVKMSHEQAKK